MSFLSIQNVKIMGLSACVPKNIEENISLPIFKDQAEAEKVIASTGIERRHVVVPGTTASDLSFQAASELLDSLGWDHQSVDALIYICITRDYIAPITSAILQNRLGLSCDCYCVDMPLGCSGWIYGVIHLASLLSHGDLKRGLLVCAETNTLNHNPNDKTVSPLFGDAATVTALEYDKQWDKPMHFNFGVDGAGYKAVWTEYGGMRNPITPESIEEKEVEPGVFRRGIDMIVNGMDVFSFAIKVPPRSLELMIEHFNIDVDKVDFLFLHQANHYIDDRIRKKLKMPIEKVPFCLKDYGNTNSASIPLTMVTQCAESFRNAKHECMACGFGIGLAWASMHFYTDIISNTIISEYNG